MVPMVNKLPLSIQRAISILPLNVDPIARFEAEASTEWRVRMWELLVPEVPKHFWLGKGLAVSSAELELAPALAGRSHMASQEAAILTGTYHNGPLTVLIPFGIWGAIGWCWFLVAAIRALYLNHRYGPESLQRINTFLLAFLVAKTIAFLTIYGDFRSEFVSFVGIAGFSVALNGGICRMKTALSTDTLAVPNQVLDPMPA